MRTTFVIFALAAAACGAQPTTVANNDPPAPKPTWSANVSSIQEFTQLTGSVFIYTPDPGYVWAKMQVSVTNLESTERCLNWLEDGFTCTHKGGTYNQHLQYDSDIDWYLPKCYLPNQTQSGYVVFELPADGSVSGDGIEFKEGLAGTLDGVWTF